MHAGRPESTKGTEGMPIDRTRWRGGVDAADAGGLFCRARTSGFIDRHRNLRGLRHPSPTIRQGVLAGSATHYQGRRGRERWSSSTTSNAPRGTVVALGADPTLQRAWRAFSSNPTCGDGTRRLGVSLLRGGVFHMRIGGCQAEPDRTRIRGRSWSAPGPSPIWRPTPVWAGIERGCSQRQVSRETKRCSTGSRSWEAVCVSRTCPSVDLALGITQC